MPFYDNNAQTSFPSRFYAPIFWKSGQRRFLPPFVIVKKAPLFSLFESICRHDEWPDFNYQPLKSSLSTAYDHRPLAVATADHIAHHTAQKHQQHPSQPSNAAYYLECTDHKPVAEHKEQCKYLHTTSFSFFKDTQNP